MKILMLLYFYPPVQAVGTSRNIGLFKQFKALGLEPIVIAPANPDRNDWVKINTDLIPNDVNVHRVKGMVLGKLANCFGAVSNKLYRFIKGKDQSFNFAREHILFPDIQIGWLPFFMRKASQIIRQEKDIKTVFISCSPFSFALLAPALKKRFPHLKIVLDFRDAWQFNPYITHTNLHNYRVKRKEQNVFEYVDLFVANTSGMARLYKNAYPELNIITIPNGFDKLMPKKHRSEKFIILHAGNFYGSRNPDNLLTALDKIDRPIEFWQIGSPIQPGKIKNKSKIRHIPYVSQNEMFGYLDQASLLYLKQGKESDSNRHIAIAAKTFEYLATGIPILADVPEGDNAEIIRKYGATSKVVTSNDSGEIRESILKYYEEWQQGDVRYKIDPTFAEKYNRTYLANQLIKAINAA